MADDVVQMLLAEQRKRLIAGLLSSAEQSSWWSRLRPEEQRAFRQKVLESVGVFYDLCRDVVKVSGGSPINEHAISLIESVHASQRRIEQRVAGAT